MAPFSILDSTTKRHFTAEAAEYEKQYFYYEKLCALCVFCGDNGFILLCQELRFCLERLIYNTMAGPKIAPVGGLWYGRFWGLCGLAFAYFAVNKLTIHSMMLCSTLWEDAVKHALFVALLVVALTLSGCASRTGEGGPPASIAEQGKTAPAEGVSYDRVAQGGNALPQTRMVIYSGSLSLVVPDTLTTQRAIGELMERLGGYIESSENTNYGQGRLGVALKLRVPAERFNEAMDALRAMATEVQYDKISTEDVGQEYVDLESRLRALELRAQKLEEFLAKAEDTEAVLRVYNELSATQQEIEQVKGRMRYLERMVAMAVITVTLTPDELAQPVELPGWHPEGTVKRAFELLVRTLQGLATLLIWLVIYALPLLILFAALGYGTVRLMLFLYRKLFRKRSA